MIINHTKKNGTHILILEGRLDSKTAPQLQDELIPVLNEAKQVELDFIKIDFVSSAGLRVVHMGQQMAKTKGISMAICNISEEVMEVLETTGFLHVLTIKQQLKI